ncbi:MAG: 2-oxoacid:acceptor oxidoreductase family protein [Gammaproteobacteria bacterium]
MSRAPRSGLMPLPSLHEPDSMLEIRIHGRGGQGNVVAAYLLATAAIKHGRYGQAFPNFGAERRGAPVMAFVRITDAPIRRRCQVLEPDFLIVQDDALLHVPGVTSGLRAGGAILVNSSQDSEALSEQFGTTVYALPATALALEHLGRPVPNTALLAAFLDLTQVLPEQALFHALEGRFKGRLLDANRTLMETIVETVPTGLWADRIPATMEETRHV